MQMKLFTKQSSFGLSSLVSASASRCATSGWWGRWFRSDIGRYGPYVKAGKQSASLETPDEVFDIGLNRAVTVIAERKAKGPQRARGGAVLKELGEHPDDGKPVRVPQGKMVATGDASSFAHNEILVYREDQHRIRYVLLIDW